MPTIPIHSITSLDGSSESGLWETKQNQYNTLLDMSNPRFPRHIILDSSGIIITRPGQVPAHLTLLLIIKAAIVANPMLTSPPYCKKSPDSMTLKVGESGTFTSAFESLETPIMGYQWEAVTKGATAPSALLGETKDTLTLTASSDFNGNQYRCVATSLAGSTASNPAILNVI